MTLVTLVFISLVLFSFSIKTTTLTQAYCLPDQRDALIQLKQGFSTTKLHSWNASTDCCIWDGITCDEQTGMVTALNLIGKFISGEINPALFNLSSLRYLNLAGNDFHNLILSQIGFERLDNLTHLDLSYSGFTGQVPIGISALTNLISLNLSYFSEELSYNYSNRNTLYLHGTGLKTLLSNLTKLQVLRLDGVDISLNESEWGKAIFQVGPTLQELSMADCGLRGNFPNEMFHLPNLTKLDLSYNSKLYLHGTGLKTLLSSLTKLQVLRLDLVDISLNGSELGKAIFQVGSTLQELSMVDCGLRGNLPNEIFHLTNLIELDLSSYNSKLHLHGTGLKTLLSNLTKLQVLRLDLVDISLNGSELGKAFFQVGPTLQELSMVDCGLRGNLPNEIFHLTNLIELDLSSYNSKLHLHGTGLKTLLSNLTKLQVLRLDLVDISLNGSELGKAFSQVGPTLQELSMVDCGLRGNLPNEIFHLTNLIELDLSSYNSKLHLHGTGLKTLLSNLTNLQVLRLDLVDISLNGSELGKAIFQVGPTLQELSMRNCGLRGTIPMSLFSHPSLISLYLSNNQLSGYLTEFSNESLSLACIFLDFNNLQGQLPISIFKLPQLLILSLASNNFDGTLNLDIIKGNKKLDWLDFSNNKLSIIEGKNHSESFYDLFPQISLIGLVSCNLTKFPSFLNYQTQIEYLDLSNNKINGVIPNWLWNNEGIISLNLSHNFFTKIEGDAHFTSLSSLATLDIHSNRISGPVPLLPPGVQYVDFSSNYFFLLPPYFDSNPYYLSFSNNHLTGEIPLSICNKTWPLPDDQSILQVLDLSYNNLPGTVPPCLLEDAEFREVLNLKSNQLSGSLPQNISQGCQLKTIDLSGNRINGSLPQSLMNCNNLEVLDLGNNQIVDGFPFWLGNLQNLRVLVLRTNQFYGTISNMEAKTKKNNSFFPALKVFDLSSNRFSGNISQIGFQNLKAMMSNSDSSTFKFGVSNYYQNSITVIWKGEEMEIMSSLSIFSSLDLSQNEFLGEIPKDIGKLKSLDVLNLSHNALIGSIPTEFANLQQLQSLDLSFNQLSGNIPQEFTSLTFLSALNLSYNKLVGNIPHDQQFSTFSNASYLGNPGLCGSPLSIQCPAAPSNEGFNKDLLPSRSSTDIIEFSVSVGLGLGVGFVSVIWVLISWKNVRERFNFIVDRFYFRYFH